MLPSMFEEKSFRVCEGQHDARTGAEMDLGIAEKIALVSGGDSGIGFETARRLHAGGGGAGGRIPVLGCGEFRERRQLSGRFRLGGDHLACAIAAQ